MFANCQTAFCNARPQVSWLLIILASAIVAAAGGNLSRESNYEAITSDANAKVRQLQYLMENSNASFALISTGKDKSFNLREIDAEETLNFVVAIGSNNTVDRRFRVYVVDCSKK